MSDQTRKLYGYWRSSAAYRVRIALNLKGLPYSTIPVHLVDNGGEQHAPDYHAINPQELVPTLVEGERVFRQSLAIIEYLDEMYPQTAPLLPADARSRARVRSLALAVACDVHPLNNSRVLQYLERNLHIAQDQRDAWVRHWIAAGFAALEELVANEATTGTFCHGDTPTLADVLLIPQLYNARRWSLELGAYPTLLRVEAACVPLEAFERARPENQPDAPESSKG